MAAHPRPDPLGLRSPLHVLLARHHRFHWLGLDSPAATHIRAIDNSALMQVLIAEFAAIFAAPQGSAATLSG
jgi:hypothetical protein